MNWNFNKPTFTRPKPPVVNSREDMQAYWRAEAEIVAWRAEGSNGEYVLYFERDNLADKDPRDCFFVMFKDQIPLDYLDGSACWIRFEDFLKEGFLPVLPEASSGIRITKLDLISRLRDLSGFTETLTREVSGVEKDLKIVLASLDSTIKQL